ncbi:MAG: hypothetical protein ACT6RE_09125 [Flavobacteriales bacterium]
MSLSLHADIHKDDLWVANIIRNRKLKADYTRMLIPLFGLLCLLVPASVYFFWDQEYRSQDIPERISMEQEIPYKGTDLYAEFTESCYTGLEARVNDDETSYTYSVLRPCSETSGPYSRAVIVKTKYSSDPFAAVPEAGRLAAYSGLPDNVLNTLNVDPLYQPVYLFEAGETPESSSEDVWTFVTFSAFLLALCTFLFFHTHRQHVKDIRYFEDALQRRIDERRQKHNYRILYQVDPRTVNPQRPGSALRDPI